MPNQPHNLLDLIYLGAITLGAGALDYAYGIYSKRITWSILSFLLHVSLAMFSGAMAVMVVFELGYGWPAAGAAAGLAGGMRAVSAIRGTGSWLTIRYIR